ncbi:MAG TPA: hypothetical protein PKK31_01650 [Elusimicrobiales bacterium]|nr:hypothetical protein [Elusimicrobiales bacterium]
MVTDPQGRRTGYDATAPFNETLLINEVHEIPGSNYMIEGIADNTGEGIDEASYRELYIHTPLPGNYTIQIVGKRIGAYRLFADFHKSDLTMQPYEIFGFSVTGQSSVLSAEYDPAPDALPIVIIKTTTFDSLRNDVVVARQLNQLGDEKFARSLIVNIDLAEKLARVCDKRKGKKDKPCQPAIAVLKLFIKRLELANRKCDDSADCDEEREWTVFRKERGKDDDFKDFWREWDRDDWHKHKKKCRRFVTDEALKIIKEDAGWLIKSLGEKSGEEHGKPGPGGHGRGKGGKD